jgi:hypothetical protein
MPKAFPDVSSEATRAPARLGTPRRRPGLGMPGSHNLPRTLLLSPPRLTLSIPPPEPSSRPYRQRRRNWIFRNRHVHNAALVQRVIHARLFLLLHVEQINLLCGFFRAQQIILRDRVFPELFPITLRSLTENRSPRRTLKYTKQNDFVFLRAFRGSWSYLQAATARAGRRLSEGRSSTRFRASGHSPLPSHSWEFFSSTFPHSSRPFLPRCTQEIFIPILKVQSTFCDPFPCEPCFHSLKSAASPLLRLEIYEVVRRRFPADWCARRRLQSHAGSVADQRLAPSFRVSRSPPARWITPLCCSRPARGLPVWSCFP